MTEWIARIARLNASHLEHFSLPFLLGTSGNRN
jgi:hypothetical protein